MKFNSQYNSFHSWQYVSNAVWICRPFCLALNGYSLYVLQYYTVPLEMRNWKWQHGIYNETKILIELSSPAAQSLTGSFAVSDIFFSKWRHFRFSAQYVTSKYKNTMLMSLFTHKVIGWLKHFALKSHFLAFWRTKFVRRMFQLLLVRWFFASDNVLMQFTTTNKFFMNSGENHANQQSFKKRMKLKELRI